MFCSNNNNVMRFVLCVVDSIVPNILLEVYQEIVTLKSMIFIPVLLILRQR